MKINNPKLILVFVLLFFIFVHLMIAFGKWLDLKESLVVFTSAAITASGWYFSAYLNHRSFERSEFIKNKDKITSLIENFFDELEELVSKRETSEKDIDDFVSSKTAELSLKAEQLKRVFKSEIRFLSTQKITELQNTPIDLFSQNYKEQIEELKKLKRSTLEEIDEHYEKWLKSL